MQLWHKVHFFVCGCAALQAMGERGSQIFDEDKSLNEKYSSESLLLLDCSSNAGASPDPNVY